jgi:hypothetical protein
MSRSVKIILYSLGLLILLIVLTLTITRDYCPDKYPVLRRLFVFITLLGCILAYEELCMKQLKRE